MDLLHTFYNNQAEREAVKAFMIETLALRAVDKVFTKQAIAGVYEARKTIDDMFDRLEELYKPKEKPVIQSPR